MNASPAKCAARWSAGAFLALVLLNQAGLSQGDPAPLPIEALLTAPRLSPVTVPAFAPDGQRLAYTVVDHGRKAKFDPMSVPLYGVNGDIWISRISGDDARSLTLGKGNNWGPSWSPDGRWIAFLSDRGSGAGGQAHLWIWDVASGRLHQVGRIPALDPWGRLGRLEWLADSRNIVVKTLPEGMPLSTYRRLRIGDSNDEPAKPDTGITARVLRSDPADSQVAPRSDPTNLDDFLGGLALVDVETGMARRLSPDSRICSYALSPNRRMLAWATAKRFERPGSYQILSDLFVYDFDKKELRLLTENAPLAAGYVSAPLFSWSPTSRAIAYRTDGPPGLRDRVYVVPVDGGAPRRIAEGPAAAEMSLGSEARPLWQGEEAVLFPRAGALWRAPVSGTGAVPFASAPDRQLRMIEHGYGTLWSADGGRSTVVITGNLATKRMGLARVDLQTGALTQLLEQDRWYDTTRGGPPAVVPDRSAIVYVGQESRNPPDLWLAHGDGDPRPHQISRVAPGLAAFTGGAAEIIAWRGLDGDTLHGALLYPAGYRAGIRYPLIVKVYGGFSISDDINKFGLASTPVENLQVFASRGYAVLLADSRLHVGTPMLDLVKTVMPGVDRVVELGVADPARIGVMGHSYGGYSTLALLTQSRRFKAAVVRAGIGDLIGGYGQLSPAGTNYLLPWAEQGQGRMGGTPWEVRERYVENSPIFYLDRIEAPILLIHGAADHGVPPFLADQVFTGLRRLGKRVEYARYAGESHSEEGWSLPNQIDFLHRVVAWFERHLKGDTVPAKTR